MLSFYTDGLVANPGVFYYILVYSIGIIAMTFSVIAFQFKHRVAIILCNFLGQTSWVAHFLLQGDLTSAITCGLSAIMLAVFAKQSKWKWVKSPFCIIFFIILISSVSILSFATWSDVFPILAGIFAVIANSRTNEKRLRQFSLLWCAFWLLNSSFKMYPVAFINDLFSTISAIVSLIRYKERNNHTSQERMKRHSDG